LVHVFAYVITTGALDADACAAPNATTPTTATIALMLVMTSSWLGLSLI
jgi:hypothetical protein